MRMNVPLGFPHNCRTDVKYHYESMLLSIYRTVLYSGSVPICSSILYQLAVNLLHKSVRLVRAASPLDNDRFVVLIKVELGPVACGCLRMMQAAP